MPKIDTESLKFILQRNVNDPRTIAEIMQEITQELQAEEGERAERPPAIKKQFAILVADTEGRLKGTEVVGWVLQIPEDESPATVVDRVHSAAYDFNATPKGSRMPIKTIGEACEVIPVKTLKEQSVWVKTKTPVLIVSTDNKIPAEG